MKTAQKTVYSIYGIYGKMNSEEEKLSCLTFDIRSNHKRVPSHKTTCMTQSSTAKSVPPRTPQLRPPIGQLNSPRLPSRSLTHAHKLFPLPLPSNTPPLSSPTQPAPPQTHRSSLTPPPLLAYPPYPSIHAYNTIQCSSPASHPESPPSLLTASPEQTSTPTQETSRKQQQ